MLRGRTKTRLVQFEIGWLGNVFLELTLGNADAEAASLGMSGERGFWAEGAASAEVSR